MTNPSLRHVVRAALPGTERDIAAATGLGRMTVHRHIKAMHAAGLIHVARWHRPSKGLFAAVYRDGPGEDVELVMTIYTAAEVSKRYRARKNRRQASPFDALGLDRL